MIFLINWLTEFSKVSEVSQGYVTVSQPINYYQNIAIFCFLFYIGQTRMLVLNYLFAKPMTRARYFCAGALEPDSNISHFALSMPIYTHFTSPIRRYADIMVHRLLAATFKTRLNQIRKIPKRPKWIVETVSSIATHCNLQKYHAKKAGDASSDLYLAHYIEQHQPCIEEAVVVDAKERTFDVIVIKTGSVVRLYTNVIY